MTPSLEKYIITDKPHVQLEFKFKINSIFHMVQTHAQANNNEQKQTLISNLNLKRTYVVAEWAITL